MRVQNLSHTLFLFILTILLIPVLPSYAQPESEKQGLPTFEELLKLYEIEEFSDEYWEASEALDKRLKPTQDMIDSIVHSGQPVDILSLAMIPIKSSTDPTYYQMALEKRPRNKLILATTIIFCIHENRDIGNESLLCKSQRKRVNRLNELDPDNALPAYLLAYFAIKEGQTGLALKHLKEGNSRDHFQSYVMPLFLAIKNGLKKMNYSKFLSNLYAFAAMTNNMNWTYKLDLCDATNPVVSPEIIKECLRMGEIIEKNTRTLSEQNEGIVLQEKAFKILDVPNRSQLLKMLKSRKERMNNATRLPFKTNHFTEKQWVQFYEIFEKYGEEKAFLILKEWDRAFKP